MFNLDSFKNKDLKDKILFYVILHMEQSFIDDSFISEREFIYIRKILNYLKTKPKMKKFYFHLFFMYISYPVVPVMINISSSNIFIF